jgi:3'-phosphoadenosine 5'-phosphosulfate sulfotransferase (PAPS reductase)/FAD synthetase
MNHIVSFSTGLSSALTVDRVLTRYGKEATQIVFMDTKIEDADNYRFLNDCQKRWNHPITVLAEGRTPYEVFSDQNLIPNGRVAPCTFRLKIEIFRAYLLTQEKPLTIHIGYDFAEMHRIEKTQSNYESLGYIVDFPLLWKPYELRRYTDVVRGEWNIEPPRMYELGYTHANCGGLCVKQGQGDWIRTLINFPERYAEAEEWEREMRTHSERHAQFSICKDQSNGETTPLTLRQLRERHEAKPMDLFKLDYNSACVVCGVGDMVTG